MKSKKPLILIAVLLIGLLVVGGIFVAALLLSGSSEPTEQVAMTEVEAQSETGVDTSTLGSVVVVKQDVTSRTTITAEMLEVQNIPAQYIHPMAVTDYKEALEMISLVPINAGEQLIQTKIADPTTNYLSYKLKEGHVAFTVPVSDLTANAGMVRVGDQVHVLGNFTEDVAGEDMTQFLLSDLLIISIGQDMAVNAMAPNGGLSNMTLEVTPEEATQLSWAVEYGNLSYILKSVLEDQDLEDIEMVTAEYFFGDIDGFKDTEYKDALSNILEIRELESEVTDEDRLTIQKEVNYDRYGAQGGLVNTTNSSNGSNGSNGNGTNGTNGANGSNGTGTTPPTK